MVSEGVITFVRDSSIPNSSSIFSSSWTALTSSPAGLWREKSRVGARRPVPFHPSPSCLEFRSCRWSPLSLLLSFGGILWSLCSCLLSPFTWPSATVGPAGIPSGYRIIFIVASSTLPLLRRRYRLLSFWSPQPHSSASPQILPHLSSISPNIPHTSWAPIPNLDQ